MIRRKGTRRSYKGGSSWVVAVLVLWLVLGCAGTMQPTGDRIAATLPATAPTAEAATSTPEPTVAPSPTNVPTDAPTTTPQPTVMIAASLTPAVTPDASADSPQSESLIKLADPLDEPEFYCVDVVGHRTGVRLDRALHAHTCKPGFEDELFLFDTPETGQLYMRAYDLCLEARENQVYLEPCSDSAMQSFDFGEDGTLRPEGTDVCLAVEAGSGQQAGGVSHVRRDLLLVPCYTVDANLSRWVMPGPSP